MGRQSAGVFAYLSNSLESIASILLYTSPVLIEFVWQTVAPYSTDGSNGATDLAPPQIATNPKVQRFAALLDAWVYASSYLLRHRNRHEPLIVNTSIAKIRCNLQPGVPPCRNLQRQPCWRREQRRWATQPWQALRAVFVGTRLG